MILTAAGIKESFGHASRFGPMMDRRYFMVEEGYLLHQFLPFWKSLKRDLGITYRPGIVDCDKFVLLFRAEIIKAALRMNTDAAPAVGQAQVVNDAETLGIGPGNHVLTFIGMVTAAHVQKWILFDPITDLHVPLRHYPNEFTLLSI